MRRIVFSIPFCRQVLLVQLVFTSTKSRRKFYTQVVRQSFHTASTRSGRNRTDTEITKGLTRMSTDTLPSAHDEIAFCDEFTYSPEVEIGKGIAKLRHKLQDSGASFLRLMHRVMDEYVGRCEFVYDSWVPRIPPKFPEPTRYGILILLHRIASVRYRLREQHSRARTLVVSLRT